MNPKYLIFISFCILLFACHQEKPDPCAGLSPTSADFVMEEAVLGKYTVNGKTQDYRYFEVDSIYGGQTVRFTAKNDLESYAWHIGADPRTFTSKSFSLDFFSYCCFEGVQTIHVVLIGQKAPDKTCFPEDDGIDTVRKTLVVIPHTKTPLVGEYEGFNTNSPNEKFTVKLFYDDNDDPGVLNLNNGCQAEFLINSGFASFKLPENVVVDLGCFKPSGWGYLNKRRDSLTIDYQMLDPTLYPQKSQFISLTFKGKRIK